MFARVHTLETTPDQYEEGLRIVRDELLPWARESTGFRGLIGLSNRERSTSYVITLWADEESFTQSAEAGDALSRLAAAASGASRLGLEPFVVEIFDVRD